MTQNIQKSIKQKFHHLNLVQPIRSSKMGVVYQKNFLIKCSQINFRKSHKISKRFDEKQKNRQTKDWEEGSTGTLLPPR